MKRIWPVLALLLLGSTAWGDTITVAAAISLKDALTRAAAQYHAQTGQEVEFTFASSGQLASQVLNGAPVDLFISAANKQVDDLARSGAVEPSTRKVIAGNTMVLIVPPDEQSPPQSIQALAGKTISKVAIGEPRTVPAGHYARQVLQHARIAEAVSDKLVLGMNVRQVLDYVQRGEVSAGLVYSTDARIAGAKVRITYTCKDGEHEPIVYPAILVKASPNKAAAGRFLDFLLSEKGQACLAEYGFTPPPAPKDKPAP